MKGLYLIILGFIIVQPSCSKDDKVELFRWTVEAPLELRTNADVFTEIGTELSSIPNTIQGQLSLNNLTESDIGQIEVLEASLITEDGSVLNFMTKLELDVFDLNDRSNDVEIAFRETVEASTGTEIRMFPNIPNAQMTELFLMDFVGLRLTYGVDNPNSNINARLIVRLRVVE